MFHTALARAKRDGGTRANISASVTFCATEKISSAGVAELLKQLPRIREVTISDSPDVDVEDVLPLLSESDAPSLQRWLSYPGFLCGVELRGKLGKPRSE